MAVMVAKSATTEAELASFYKTICMTDFVSLLIESVFGFSDGFLPGNLGDTLEALDTGEGSTRLCGVSVSFVACLSACFKFAHLLLASLHVQGVSRGRLACRCMHIC